MSPPNTLPAPCLCIGEEKRKASLSWVEQRASFSAAAKGKIFIVRSINKHNKLFHWHWGLQLWPATHHHHEWWFDRLQREEAHLCSLKMADDVSCKFHPYVLAQLFRMHPISPASTEYTVELYCIEKQVLYFFSLIKIHSSWYLLSDLGRASRRDQQRGIHFCVFTYIITRIYKWINTALDYRW